MSDMDQVFDWHLAHYPLLKAVDIYKLIHQGVFGPGHIIENPEQARKALEQEFAEIRRRCCVSELDRTEPLDPEGKLVRVNLETLRSIPDVVDVLVPILLETSRTVSPDPRLMRQRLAEAIEWCARELPEEAGWLAEMADAAPVEEFPALHHSKVYQTAYQPSYRVVRLDLAEPLLRSPKR